MFFPEVGEFRYKWRKERIVAESKKQMNGLCNEGNAILHWHLERRSEQDMILSQFGAFEI